MLRRFWLAAIVLPALFCVAASAQSADDIVSKNIAARGGLEKIKAIKSLKLTGKALIGGGLEAPAVIQQTRPSNFRLDITFQGKNIIQAWDGSEGWSVNPFSGSSTPEKMSAEDTDDLKDQADFDGVLVEYKEKGHKVELVGKEDLEGSPVYKLKITLKGGGIQYNYIDADTYLTLKESSKRTREGTEIEQETVFSDFKPVNGVLFPFTFESKVGGRTQFTMVMDKIEANTDVADGIFKSSSVATP